jgi:hypothetical protein
MHFIPRLIFLCGAIFTVPVMAAPLSDLYKVREPVASQQPAEREEAIRNAFDTLVLRLTGEAKVDQPSVAELRNDPQQLVSRYAYEGDVVVVNFDSTTTERALRTAGLSLWGADRPSLLTWWLTESVEGARLVGDAQDGARRLQAAAQHRGLPLRLPLADLGEQLAATAEALSAKDPGELRQVSERYESDGLLTVVARPSNEAMEASWRLWIGDKQTQGKVNGDSQEALADAVMLAVSQYLAPQYRVAPGETSELTLEVLGADIDRFAELDRLLEPFGGRLLRVESDRLVYRLNASPERLRTQLALAKLREVPAETLPLEPLSAEAPLEEPGEPATASAPVPAAEDEGEVLRFSW